MNKDVNCPNCKTILADVPAELAGPNKKHHKIMFCDDCGLWVIVGQEGTVIDFSFVKPSMIKKGNDEVWQNLL